MAVALTYRDYHNKSFSKFELKMMELEDLKNEANRHVGRLNSLKMRYMDWFLRCQQSFLDSIKLIHILGGDLLPREINTIRNFKKVMRFSGQLPSNGTPRDGSKGKMIGFLLFWEEMLTLKRENDALYRKICDFCNSIRRLREPILKDEIDRLHQRLNLFLSEDYDFTAISNDRHNLFTYRVALHDHRYHGLVSYIPFLLSIANKLCYWTSKLYIEFL
ncbi:uncharacterized protein LOC133197094 [Saccostrea echinata]|uniref:uncharacterized protein LOC133193419 n=1 Tax=Saccostrea echinata TaxID=191078 RepID=UPI002A7F862B|nr:uncharacterized protein LOC133193419 [Saccostrea echinata]XP_061185339.1 uncharacterized protein LOC133193419 [Saccostrea echinata]XP_061188917.1 uncharacterized protein LOC133197094 [Saccostrea echinata]XP_061188919.1 uncharacterized protein LOC133197094 [Saccostrea echinata]